MYEFLEPLYFVYWQNEDYKFRRLCLYAGWQGRDPKDMTMLQGRWIQRKLQQQHQNDNDGNVDDDDGGDDDDEPSSTLNAERGLGKLFRPVIPTMNWRAGKLMRLQRKD